MAKIRHMAIYTDDPAKLADFYVDVFGLEKKQETHTAKGGHAVWLTDGYLEVALINPEIRESPRGINHFGFTLEPGERDGVYAAFESARHRTGPRADRSARISKTPFWIPTGTSSTFPRRACARTGAREIV